MLEQYHFVHPGWLVLALVAPVLVWLWNRRQPSIGHSKLSLHKNLRSVSVLVLIPALLFTLAIASIGAALADPQTMQPAPGKVVPARDILFAVDISTNMSEPYNESWYTQGANNPATGPNGGTSPKPSQGCGKPSNWGDRKLDLAAYAVCDLTTNLPGNRYALEAFDGSVYWYAPFVTDSKIVLNQSRNLNQYMGNGNTNFDGPDASEQEGPGAYQEALDFLKQYSQSKTKVLIVISDGDGSIESDRFNALTAMTELGVHVYLMGVGEDSSSNDPPSNDPNHFTLNLGGQILDSNNPQQMKQLINEIKAMPTSPVRLDAVASPKDDYQEFIQAALVLMLAFLLVNSLLKRTT